MATPGERFTQALGRQDAGALRAVLAGTIDFQALTPRRHWAASTGREVADEIVLGHWFGPGADVAEVCSVTTGQVADTAHVAYRLRVRESGTEYLVEQQAYYRADGPRITWMRVLCSGYRPVRAARAGAGG
jgi:hypothetical protein